MPRPSLYSWIWYMHHKIAYSASVCAKRLSEGQITPPIVVELTWKDILTGRLTYVLPNKGEPLLVRKLTLPSPEYVFVGDLVALKDPEEADNYLVRRLTAVGGYEMVSTDDKEEPFVLEKNQCWVVAENEDLKPKEAKDSRSFGPVNMFEGVVGRVIYRMRTAGDHGCVQNSPSGMKEDWPVLAVELDVEEMSKNHKD